MSGVILEHLAVGVNRCAGCLHWGECGLVAYGAHNAVVLYDAQAARIVATLLGHTARINCVRWFSSADLGTDLLASGAGDSAIRLWRWQPANTAKPWAQLAVLQGHAAPVTSLTTFSLGDGGALLVSTASGADEVLIWELDGGDGSSSDGGCGPRFHLAQRIHVGLRMQDCAAVASLPGEPEWLLLALGGVDYQVHLLARPPGGRFEEACRLAGHQDWVRGLAFARQPDGCLLLASASQDKNVRLWVLARDGQRQQQGQQNGAAAAGPGSAGDGAAAQLQRYAPKLHIFTRDHCYTAILESVLVGHEDWVHSVAWQPSASSCGDSGGSSEADMAQPPCLLTAAMDRTMMLWRPNATTGLWMAEESVGDAGTQHLGYFTGVWSPDGCAILAHGYTGALHLWRRQPGGGGRWVPEPALGGHYGPVVDACWAADGACLLTVSADQTARLSTALAPGGHWCELARPQVHGHDFACVAALPQLRDAPGCFLYASGSEEKVIRVFQGPQAFADTLALARGFEPAQPPAAAVAGGHMIEVLGATLPALGLSNKAVYALEEEDADANEEGEEGGGLLGGYTHGPDLAPASAVPAAVSGPPLEEHLAQNTLWPEIHKLYGHGNDLFALAADPQGQYLASACRAQAPDVAAVWLWDTRRWTGAGVLAAHTLTVTQLAFSPSGDALASASRDRGVALFARQETGGGGSGGSPDAGPPFRLVGRVAKAHGRIVWGLDWSPDGLLIATGSRDASVKLWSCRAGIRAGGEGAGAALVLPEAPAASLSLPDSVRAVAFAPVCRPGRLYHLAVGLEDGSLQLLRVWFSGGCEDSAPPVAAEAAPVWQSSPFMQHAAAVRRLCWRRREESEAGARGSADYLMASVGEDHAVRVFAIDAALLDPAA